MRSLYTAAGALDHHIHYYYNQEWQVVEERKEPSGGVIDTDPVNQYVWHPDYVDSLAMRRHDGNVDGAIVDANEGKHYYLQDANFNVTAVVNDAGSVVERYAYTSYGTPTILNGAADADAGVSDFSLDANQQSDISNVYLYTGRERDPETGLQLNRYRFYAAHLGRFINRDPIEYRGGMHLYRYVGSQPTVSLDPSGLSTIDKLPMFYPDPDGPGFIEPHPKISRIEVPYRDFEGRIHDPIPEDVPPEWGPETVEEAIREVEESIKQRQEQGRENNGLDERHDRRLKQERDWLENLKRREEQLRKRQQQRGPLPICDPCPVPPVPIPIFIGIPGGFGSPGGGGAPGGVGGGGGAGSLRAKMCI